MEIVVMLSLNLFTEVFITGTCANAGYVFSGTEGALPCRKNLSPSFTYHEGPLAAVKLFVVTFETKTKSAWVRAGVISST